MSRTKNRKHCPACGQFLKKGTTCTNCRQARTGLVPNNLSPSALAIQGEVGEYETPALFHYERFQTLQRSEAEIAVPQEDIGKPQKQDTLSRLEKGELPLLMTAQEIKEHFSPTSGDRLYWYENGRGTPDHEETDEEFWDRKLREAQGEERRHRFPQWPKDGEEDRPIPPAPSQDSPGFAWSDDTNYRSEHGSLYEDIKENGVNSPISLGAEKDEETGTKQVLGGNHRVAAMSDIDPNAPLPVVFYKTAKEARDSLGEDY